MAAAALTLIDDAVAKIAWHLRPLTTSDALVAGERRRARYPF